MDQDIQKARQDIQKETGQRDGQLKALHGIRQKLYLVLGQTVGGNTNDTLKACNELADMHDEDRADFVKSKWSPAHLERVEPQLAQLRMAEDKLRSDGE